jgi:arylsulfatase A-like enzyme
VCSPSRASIMTGKYTPRHGVTDWIGAKTGTAWKRNDKVLPSPNANALPHDDISLAEAMKEAGYKTFFAGKWHIGGTGSFPTDHGFEINKGGHHKGSPPGGFFSPYKNPVLENGPDGESLPIRLANETAKFIEDNKDNNFFAYLSFYSVHGPIQTTKELRDKYRKKAEAAGLAESRFLFDRTLPVRQVQDNPIYAGMMESMDDAVGIVMNKLEELGIADNTVLIFTGDNGSVTSGDAYSTSVLPMRGGKGRQWEGGIREPYYINVPGMTKPGSITETPATGTDFYPTILELADLPLKPEQHMDGVSLVPVLSGKTIPKRDLFWHYPHYGNQGGEPSSIIRSCDIKLIHYWEDGRDELYNINDDIGEQQDIAAAHPEKVKTLRAKLDIWLKDVGAKIPKQDSRFDAAKKVKQLEAMRTKKLQSLEKGHANYLKPEWQPNKDWWGSQITKD